MSVEIDSSKTNDTNPISIHKIIDEEFILVPGEKRVVKMIVFGRRVGNHSLKNFKIIDKSLKSDMEHQKAGGYTYSSPKFTIVD